MFVTLLQVHMLEMNVARTISSDIMPDRGYGQHCVKTVADRLATSSVKKKQNKKMIFKSVADNLKTVRFSFGTLYKCLKSKE